MIWSFPYLISNLLVLLVFLGYYLAMPRLNNRRDRAFLALLSSQAAVMVLSIAIDAQRLGEWTPHSFTLSALYTGWCVLFLFNSFCSLLFTACILGLRAEEYPRQFWAASSIFLLSEAVMLSNGLTHAVYTLDGGVFRPGPLYWLFCLSVFFALLSLALILFFSRRLTAAERFSAVLSAGILLAGYVIRLFINTNLSVNTACLLSSIILYLTFENPHLYLAGRGSAFNITGFRMVMEEALGKKHWRLLSFVLRDYIDMRGIYGGRQINLGVALISDYLVKTWPEFQVFYLKSGRFALLGTENLDFDLVRGEIYRRFQSPWTAADAELDLSAVFVQMEAGSGPDTVDGILNYLFMAYDNIGEALPLSDGLIDPGTIREIDYMVDVKRALERAVEQNEVEIFLQPLFDGKARCLAGAEVLSRIRDEHGSLISPSVFVPIAEKNGRINLMGEQVLEKTCQFVRDHDLSTMGLNWLNVNLSPIQCMKTDLSRRFSDILHQYGVSTNIIHLEITEQSVLDIPRLESQIQILQRSGFRFSLDDYGSGYSNLSRVKQYPFANIKLDMGVVWDYYRDKEKDVLLPTVVRAFKDMGFSVTAEGIETKEIADAMCDLGCDYLQGYYFSKPLPVQEFVEKYGMAS